MADQRRISPAYSSYEGGHVPESYETASETEDQSSSAGCLSSLKQKFTPAMKESCCSALRKLGNLVCCTLAFALTIVALAIVLPLLFVASVLVVCLGGEGAKRKVSEAVAVVLDMGGVLISSAMRVCNSSDDRYHEIS